MVAPSRSRIAVIAACLSVFQPPLRAMDAVPTVEPPRPASASLIPRALLFGNPDRTDAGISPDGARISFLAPVDGVMNIWTCPFGKLGEAKPATRLKGRGLGVYMWTFRPNLLLFSQDHDGDENNHVYRVDSATGEVKDLTPGSNVKAYVVGTSSKHPDEILIAMNARSLKYDDIFRVNIVTGESRRILKNTRYLGVLTDDDLALRVGLTADGPEEIKGRLTHPMPVRGTLVDPGLPAFDSTGEYVHLLSRNGTDKTAVLRVRFKDGETTRVAESRSADIVDAVMSPITKEVQAVWECYQLQQWQIVDDKVFDDFAVLRSKLAGEFYIHDRTLDDGLWIVSHNWDRSPGAYYLYNRKDKSLSLLFASKPSLSSQSLAPMVPEVIEARDGMKMVGYLTLPAGSDSKDTGKPDRPLPMVLWVHGGPALRDSWGYDPLHQWLANRGYAVLSVNYRGSTGFGKNYEDAGMKEWGGKMQADLDDAADWAVKQGIADPGRIAIGGGSYGGYAALCGIAMTPDRYACGIDICGPSNLVTMIKENQAPYFKVDMEAFKAEIGDVDSKRGREFLLNRSPLTHVADVKRPLLIGQGSNDPRVYKAESDQFVKAMEGRSVPLTYLVYPDEGHGFARPENTISFYAAMEAFLAKHLAGRAEPIGSDLKGSSVQVVTGAAEIPGLVEASGTPSSR